MVEMLHDSAVYKFTIDTDIHIDMSSWILPLQIIGYSAVVRGGFTGSTPSEIMINYVISLKSVYSL